MNFTKKVIISLSVITSVALSSNAATTNETSKTQISKETSVLEAYSNIALASYSDTLKDAKEIIEKWREEYNNWRPHSSLGGKTPVEYNQLNRNLEIVNDT